MLPLWRGREHRERTEPHEMIRCLFCQRLGLSSGPREGVCIIILEQQFSKCGSPRHPRPPEWETPEVGPSKLSFKKPGGDSDAGSCYSLPVRLSFLQYTLPLYSFKYCVHIILYLQNKEKILFLWHKLQDIWGRYEERRTWHIKIPEIEFCVHQSGARVKKDFKTLI